MTALFGTLGKSFLDSLKGGTQLDEKEMYRIVRGFLRNEGYKTPEKKQRFYKKKINTDIGQGYIELDVIGYKDDSVWIIECKKYCTIEQFGWALGQLICYKFLFGLRKDIKTKYSIALLETEKYPLTDRLLETFKTILHSNNLAFGLLIINEKSKEVRDVLDDSNTTKPLKS